MFYESKRLFYSVLGSEKMPNVTYCGNQFNIKPLEDGNNYLDSFATTLSRMGETESNLDVKLHCQGSSTLKCNKIILANCSGLLSDIFSIPSCNCPLASFIPLTFDLICPDFDSRAMEKVLEMISRGSTTISFTDRNLLEEMKIILESLQIDNLLQLLNSVIEETSFHVDEPYQKGFDSQLNVDKTPPQSKISTDTNLFSSFPKSEIGVSIKKELATQNGDLSGQASSKRPIANTLMEKSKKKIKPVRQPIKPIKVEKKPRKRKSPTMKYRCHVCPKEFIIYSRIMSHFTDTHFYMNLVGMYPLLRKKCHLCSKEFSSKCRLFYHLATSHNALDGLIPDKKLLKI